LDRLGYASTASCEIRPVTDALHMRVGGTLGGGGQSAWLREGFGMAELSEYEVRALAEIEKHRADQLQHSSRRLVPKRVREAAAKSGRAAQGRLQAMPGGDKLLRRTALAYAKAGEGIGKAVARTGRLTLSESRVLRSYKRRGHQVNELAAIRELDLKIVEHVRPKRMDVLYAASAGLEGALAGGVVSGGEALATIGTVFGAGAGAAPGVGAVATAMASDAAFVLGAGSRAVAHTAMHYGYDPLDPGERLFMMAVLNLGTAATSGAKYTAYKELSQLAQGLARRKAWAVLEEKLLTRVAQKFASDMGTRLTQKKLGQLVPVAGILVGAGLNYGMLDDICDAAYWAYRERFIRDKQGDGSTVTLPDPPPPFDAEVEDEGTEESEVSIIDMLGSDGPPELE